MENKPIKMDSGGLDSLKPAVLELLNQYPALNGRTITFSGLESDSGISIEPESGALVFSEIKNILGGVKQECQFPFFVVYRTGATSDYQKMSVNEFLDDLGAWVCRETVNIGGTEYKLEEYPALTGGRKITGVTRFNSYALEPNSNNTQDWVLPLTVSYKHEFESW